MRLSGRAWLPWGILGIVVLAAGVVWATVAASAHASPAVSLSSGAAAAAPRGTIAGAGTLSASDTSAPLTSPVWCCSAGNPLGVTVTGQATAPGAGPAARASAITRAVADAQDQAKAAVGAAGLTLGRIINMQISAPYYPYPLPMMGTATGQASGAPSVGGAPRAAGQGGASAGSSLAIPCREGSLCPNYPYPSAGTYATVTITWALG